MTPRDLKANPESCSLHLLPGYGFVLLPTLGGGDGVSTSRFIRRPVEIMQEPQGRYGYTYLHTHNENWIYGIWDADEIGIVEGLRAALRASLEGKHRNPAGAIVRVEPI